MAMFVTYFSHAVS